MSSSDQISCLTKEADRRVTVYYFYLVDEAFGPAFMKVCAYFPYPIKIWLNGHEHSKRAATAAGIGFTQLDNGFAITEDPTGLQRICDSLGPGTIRVFCERWWTRLPLPPSRTPTPDCLAVLRARRAPVLHRLP